MIIDRGEAQALAEGRQARLIDGVPLAGGTVASFRLVPLEVFAPDARIVEFDGVREREVRRPDVSIYEGEDVDDPKRTIFLSVVDKTNAWIVVHEGREARFLLQPLADPAEPGAHALVDLREVPREPIPLCDASVGEAPRPRIATGVTGLPHDGTRAARLLIDVGHDLYADTLGANSDDAAAFVANLIGAVSSIYRRDVNVALLIGKVVIWTTPDPFSGDNTGGQINTYRTWNRANRADVERAAAHLLANVNGTGGIGHLGGLCDRAEAYAVSNMVGLITSFPSTGFVWNIDLVAHELGHNFGSVHTHCYDPPLDRCYNRETGCYAGPVVPSTGETMSYCYMGGTIETGFGPVVGGVLRAGAEQASCIEAAPGVCGNGVLDAGEQCDDGNTVGGDCCASSCAFQGPAVCTNPGGGDLLGECVPAGCRGAFDPLLTHPCDTPLPRVLARQVQTSVGQARALLVAARSAAGRNHLDKATRLRRRASAQFENLLTQVTKAARSRRSGGRISRACQATLERLIPHGKGLILEFPLSL